MMSTGKHSIVKKIVINEKVGNDAPTAQKVIRHHASKPISSKTMAKSTPYSSDIFLKTYNTETGSSSSNDVYLSKFGEIVMNSEGIKKCIDELRLKRIQLRVGSGIEITLHRSCTEVV